MITIFPQIYKFIFWLFNLYKTKKKWYVVKSNCKNYRIKFIIGKTINLHGL